MKTTANMDLSTHTGSWIEARGIGDAEWSENDMVERNSWAYWGISMDKFAGC